MQTKNWNDLRHLLAIKRSGTLAAAARLQGVDDTTVSRRLNVLQDVFGAVLFLRQADGTLQLTPKGEAVAHRAEIMERQVDLIDEALGAEVGQALGSVRLTSVPMVVNRLLVPALGRLLNQHPALQIELIPDNRDLSLTRREADIALRLARPSVGGTNIKARRIGVLSYATYSSREHDAIDSKYLPWIAYDNTMAHLPQAKWIGRASKLPGETISGLKVHDAETAVEAILSWPSKTLLPIAIGERDRRLRRLKQPRSMPALTREVWLLAHADQTELSRIKAVTKWIDDEVFFGGDQ